jgi:hypothetical protein
MIDEKAEVVVIADQRQRARRLRRTEARTSMSTDKNTPARHVVMVKRGLLLFWAVWLSLVFATNVLDGAM